MESMLQLLDELDDVAGVIRLASPGLLTALAGLLIAAMIGTIWLWFPGFTLAALAGGASIFGAACAVRTFSTRHGRRTGESLSV
jgi:hypothetical protein